MARKEKQSGPEEPKSSNAANNDVSRYHGTKVSPMGTKNVKSLEYKFK